MRVFFDASVIIAALLSPTGGSALLFQFTKSGAIIGITSQTVIEEVLEEDKKSNSTKQEQKLNILLQTAVANPRSNNYKRHCTILKPHR